MIVKALELQNSSQRSWGIIGHLLLLWLRKTKAGLENDYSKRRTRPDFKFQSLTEHLKKEVFLQTRTKDIEERSLIPYKYNCLVDKYIITDEFYLGRIQRDTKKFTGWL